MPVNMKTALDILHFFTGVKSTQGKFSSNGKKPKSKICKLCAYVWTFCYLFGFLMTSSKEYGTNKSKISSNIPNFIYRPKTRNTNLQRHLYLVYPRKYDDAVSQHSWQYKLMSQLSNAPTNNACYQCDQKIPSFSLVLFLVHLVCFIVADDQVSSNNLVSLHTLKGLQSICIMECPKFQQLCMVLCENLINANIPHCSKIREAVISQWWDLFEQLKLDLFMSIGIYSFCFVNHLWS